MINPQPRRVMTSGLLSHPGGWARERPVTLSISLVIVAESPLVFLLPIVEGRPWMTYRNHQLFGKMLVPAILLEESVRVISWISSEILLTDVE